MAMCAYCAVFVPEEGGKISVWFPDVPGCQTWGENMEHAFAMAMDALEGHLEALADDNDPIPAPSHYEEVWSMMRRDFEKEGEVIPEGTVLQLVPAPDLHEKPSRAVEDIADAYLAESAYERFKASGEKGTPLEEVMREHAYRREVYKE